MRTREESAESVCEGLITWARGEDTVRAVLLVGSRAAGRDRVDELSDYDVALVLSESEKLAGQEDWLGRFGDVLVKLDERFSPPWEAIETRLVQYRDGTKIDFDLVPVDLLGRIVRDGALPIWLDGGYEVLFDKDAVTAELPDPSGEAHVPDVPSPREFRALAEEFWWEALQVARNLARRETLPARYCLERVMRYEMLVPALGWFVQRDRDWAQPVGPNGKGMEELLPERVWRCLVRTMPGARVSATWDALLAASELFRHVMRAVADDLGYAYPEELDRDVATRIRDLHGSGKEPG